MTVRDRTEKLEKKYLNAKACLSINSKGRARPEREGDLRTCFQKDRDRIIHSKAFRRLKHKTQVFLAPRGDHYRTRLTHVLEVSQIARTVARALRLNEDLTEAVALGHDLGHTPFGHAGEAILTEIHPGGFNHYEQSLRVVDFLEKNGKGLNLTHEVRDGIEKHSKGKGLIFPDNVSEAAETIEGRVVRVADIIAYVNHDIDDAIRAGVIKKSDLPPGPIKVLGAAYSKRIDTMIKDLVYNTLEADIEGLFMSEEVAHAIHGLREFLFERVYQSERIKTEFYKAKNILKRLYEYYLDDPDLFDGIPRYYLSRGGEKENKTRDEHYRHHVIRDFISGMTDRFAIMTYEKLFLPQQWTVL